MWCLVSVRRRLTSPVTLVSGAFVSFYVTYNKYKEIELFLKVSPD